MSLQSVQVIDSVSGDTLLELPLEDQFPNLFYVQNIDGLDPVDATLVSSKFANLDGEQPHGGTRITRNVIITLGLNPDYASSDVRTLRAELYKYFMPKSSVNLRFIVFNPFTDDVMVQTLPLDIKGTVESFAAPLFTDIPTATISIICYDPDFVNADQKEAFGMMRSDGEFEALNLYYSGTVETGAIFSVIFLNDTTELSLSLNNADGTVETMQFVYDFEAGDTLTFSTIPGAKSVILTHRGIDYPLLYALVSYPNPPDWIKLKPQNNIFMASFTSDGTLQPFEVRYYDRYGGL